MTEGNSNGEWHDIGGTFEMSNNDYVAIWNSGADGYVIADAVKFERQLPELVIIDDNSPGYSDSSDLTLSINPGYDGDYFHDNNTGNTVEKWAIWKPSQNGSELNGTYKVSLYWTAYANRATNATLRIYNSNGLYVSPNGHYDEFTVDMTQGSSTGQWHQIGETFSMDTTDFVMLLNTEANGYVIFDAVKFEKLNQ